ncbi:hypothetical protein LMG28614_04793 [Paraburkholderia ultramafica]|uniref:Uncharacterized protein n=1 Tax=Paraburkholderia ultramafica TaxID=1544867 RepID=A0A6S7CV61_9BURK|nr:hypothetical protein LMG28614_04793 [Paraburkholderia ultramafica]
MKLYLRARKISDSGTKLLISQAKEKVTTTLYAANAVGCSIFWNTIMQDVMLVGIDLGRHSFHLHDEDGHGQLFATFRGRRGHL